MTDNQKDTHTEEERTLNDIQAELEAKFDELFGTLNEPEGEDGDDFDFGSLDDLFADIEDEPEDEDAARRRRIDELNNEGYDFYTRADYHNAIDRFQQAAELAEELGDLDRQCESLYWEGYCWCFLGKLKVALDRLLQAEELGGGDSGVRFWILQHMFEIASSLPLAREKQANLLKKLEPYKGVRQIGDSKSTVLNCERQFFLDCGDKRGALYRAQEAFDNRVDKYPRYNDKVYYRALANAYRKNNRLPEAWRTLYDWRANGSTRFANTKSCQFRTEAQLLYTEGRLDEAWEAILTCQIEEKLLGIYGQSIATLRCIVRIGADAGKLDETRSVLPLLYRFRDSDSLYNQYDCHYCHAWYYAALASYLLTGAGGERYGAAAEARKHAERWFRRAEDIGRELDELMETDVKRKELKELRDKLG
ncbi:MAG: hypothetical protein IJQ81_17455 [Oscillibacter sp.]|nr:hypothetical protein [Oscillibacter sp.]